MPRGLGDDSVKIDDRFDKGGELEIEVDDGEHIISWWLSVSDVEKLIEILKQRLLAREAERA